jgi:hypothetical protein
VKTRVFNALVGARKPFVEKKILLWIELRDRLRSGLSDFDVTL